MRNKYPGTCYRCHKRVEKGQGHFERHEGSWRVQHATCAIAGRMNNDQYCYFCGKVTKTKEWDCKICNLSKGHP